MASTRATGFVFLAVIWRAHLTWASLFCEPTQPAVFSIAPPHRTTLPLVTSRPFQPRTEPDRRLRRIPLGTTREVEEGA